MDENQYQKAILSLVNSDCASPFGILGMHFEPGQDRLIVRAFLPGMVGVDLVDKETGAILAPMVREHADGFFSVVVPHRKTPFAYQFQADTGVMKETLEDPYRFPPMFGELDAYYLAEGTHLDAHKKLGAHFVTLEGTKGVSFAVWAPNARRVSVVGDFNHWDGRRHPMRLHPGCGVWEIYIPGVCRGDNYKFEIRAQDGRILPLKSDPYAFRCEHPPLTASIVEGLGNYTWGDAAWMAQRGASARIEAPISIYEVQLGSWRRVPEEGNRYLSYEELADTLVPYVKELGFTHIELLPVSEFPFNPSWGYQPINLFAPTSRFGSPDGFRAFVDRCHQEGIGVLLDWVAAHFPQDEHGLGYFDGTHLYEHSDPRKGRHSDWGTLIYNYGRREVGNFLIDNALFWLEEFHIDGLRVDAVSSMLYLDYSRKAGEWIPNEFGGNENLEAIAFLKRLNEVLYSRHGDIFTVAEESTAWPSVSRPTFMGGLGFGYKWNLGWMHDTLRYMGRDPLYRKHHSQDLTFGLLYAFNENFILPLSHDEVVHGKGSILGRIPGEKAQRVATLRAYLGLMFAYPGKKLQFMGNEFAQEREWNHDTSLDWHLLANPLHQGVQQVVRDLNRLYRELPALHELDNSPSGFTWLHFEDPDYNLFAFLRHGKAPGEETLVVCNFTPVDFQEYRVGVPRPGWYEELLNTDA
ncbi:MAG: 1,4-alpha-glucan branching protein GlgB, partial [Deltaproteobacteria bacterium]|nr:1,4-alpha-glucan branching protein GlgB [Deltaproteobacteria bacterium]